MTNNERLTDALARLEWLASTPFPNEPYAAALVERGQPRPTAQTDVALVIAEIAHLRLECTKKALIAEGRDLIDLARASQEREGWVLVPVEPDQAWAERFCRAVNWEPEGCEVKTIEGILHRVTLRDLATGYIRIAINEAAAPTTGGGR